MTTENVHVQGKTARALPSNYADGTSRDMRISPYGELMAYDLGNRHALADEGSYFVATNPTVGTGIAGIAASDGFNAAETFLFMRNTDATKRVYLDYIKLQATAAGTNGTNFSYAITTDKGTSRIGTGGSAITPVNTNLANSAGAPSVTVQAGAVASAAASADVRLISSGLLRTVIKVVGDTYVFVFGGAPGVVSPMAQAGTAICNMVIPVAPVVLGQNDQLLLHEFGASQTVGASYTFEVGFWVR